MFGNIKQGNIVYVLIKGEKCVIKVGQVESVTNPTPKYPTYTTTQPFGAPPEMLIDIKVKCGEEILEFQKIPTNQELFSYPNAVISDKRDAFVSEVESIMQNSLQIVESAPYHKSIADSCYEGLKKINPQFAKEKQQEEKITALESMVGSLKNDIGDIKNLLLKQSQTSSSKTTK